MLVKEELTTSVCKHGGSRCLMYSSSADTHNNLNQIFLFQTSWVK